MGRDIKIRIVSQADLAAIKTFNGELAKMAMDVGRSNEKMRQSTMLAAREYYSLGDYADKAASRTVLSARQIEAAWKKAMSSQQKEANKSKRDVTGLTRAVEILTSGAGKAAGNVGKLIKGVFSGGIWEIGAAAIRALWDYFKSQAEKAAERAKKANEDFVKSIKDGVSSTAEAFNESARAMDAYLSRFTTAVDKVKELTKAEVELAKQMAIAHGMDPGAAAAAASDLNAQIDDEAAEKKLQREIAVQQKRVDAANEAESKINADLFKAMDAKERAEAEYDRKRNEKIRRSAKRESTTVMQTSAGAIYNIVTAEEAAESRKEVGREFDESDEGQAMRKNIDALAEQVKNAEKETSRLLEEADAAQAKIDNANTELETISTKRAARELAAENEIAQKIKEEDEKAAEAAQKAAEAEGKAKIEAAKKAAAEQERLDREAATRRQQQADKELADKIKNHQKLLQAEQGDAADARRRQSLAESKLQQAWGWYRDKDSMAAQMQEEKEDAAAKKQYEKDFEKLKSKHRDWRTVENLSVDEEATRRVALAKEEKEAADKHLAEIEKNTADLAAKLDELLSVKG